MSLSELVVPLLLCFTACYALGKRVDVYTALTRGAEEGLNVLVHILPSLIALLTAVYMFRASGAMEYLGALLAPALERVGIPPEVAPLLFIRPISGSGALAVGSELMATYGPRQLHRARGGGHAGVKRDYLLHHRRLLRLGRHRQNTLHHPRLALCGRGDVSHLRRRGAGADGVRERGYFSKNTEKRGYPRFFCLHLWKVCCKITVRE